MKSRYDPPECRSRNAPQQAGREAIEQLLKQTGRPMTTTEIAMEINKNKWYQKKDGTPIDPFQIHGRTKNYPNIFNRSGSTISLNGQPNLKVSRTKKTTIKQKPILTELSTEIALLEKKLMNEKNFKSAEIIDPLVPDSSGLYCIRIKDINKLPKPFNNIIKDRNHNIIYIGIASQSLSKQEPNKPPKKIQLKENTSCFNMHIPEALSKI